MSPSIRTCADCKAVIPDGAAPNAEYVIIGYTYYCRHCYLVNMGVKGVTA